MEPVHPAWYRQAFANGAIRAAGTGRDSGLFDKQDVLGLHYVSRTPQRSIRCSLRHVISVQGIPPWQDFCNDSDK